MALEDQPTQAAANARTDQREDRPTRGPIAGFAPERVAIRQSREAATPGSHAGLRKNAVEPYCCLAEAVAVSNVGECPVS